MCQQLVVWSGNQHGSTQLVIFRILSLAVLAALLAGVTACGRTEMGVLVHAADRGGAGGIAATGGGGGWDASAGGAGGAGGDAFGPCAEATCLTSLFRTCVSEGSCSVQGGSSPSASFNAACYANGVTVAYEGSYSGANTTRKLVVGYNGTICYRIDMLIAANSSAITYVVRDSGGDEVAAGATADKTGSVAMTCKGGTPTLVGAACLESVGDNSGCAQGTCP